MRQRGVTSNDIIIICSVNHINSCVPYIAGLFLGAKVSCLDPILSSADVVHLVKLVCPKIAFVGLESLQLIEESLAKAELHTEIVTFGATEIYSDFRDFASASYDTNFSPYECQDTGETALIYFSSGTTGLPKGISLSHYAMQSQSFVLSSLGYNCSTTLSYATLYWISTGVLLVNCISSGMCRVIVGRYNYTFWKLIEQHKVTFALLPPLLAIYVYKGNRPESANTTSLCDILIAGGALSVDHMQEFREIFPGTNVSLCYGQTEVCGLALIFYANRRKDIMMMYQKPGSSGRVIFGTTCKIVDPETEEIMGPNKRGELRLKLASQMNGYHNMDSSDAWDSEGWLKTGDIAYFDADRYFYVVDRIKEMLKFQTYHVSPAAIESVIMTHPSVSTAVVVSLAHDIDGDHPVGVVVLKDPNDPINAEEIRNYVDARVSDREKLRGGVRFTDKIPVTASGKIKRIEIRQYVREGKL